MDGGQLAQRASQAPVAAGALRARLHAIAVTLAHQVQVRQVRHSRCQPAGLRRARRPVQNRAAERALSPKPVEALGRGGKPENHGRVDQRRLGHGPRLNRPEFHRLQAEREADAYCQAKPGAGQQQRGQQGADLAAAMDLFCSDRQAGNPFRHHAEHLAYGHVAGKHQGIMEFPKAIHGQSRQRSPKPEGRAHQNRQQHEREHGAPSRHRRCFKFHLAIGNHHRRGQPHQQGGPED